MLTLYDYYRSSACFRVRIALNLKNLPFEIESIHLLNNGGEQFSAAYKSLNPQSVVPTLKDHHLVMTQSLAIIEYLDEVYPTPPLLPKTAYDKALVRAFALIIAADTHPLNNLRVLKYLTNELAISEEKKQNWYNHWMKKSLEALETTLSKYQSSSDFCFGNSPTIADICLIPHLYNAKNRSQCDLNVYPLLSRIDSNCQKLEAFVNAAPVKEIA